MAYYAEFSSRLPTTFAVARSATTGEIRRFDTIVEARKFAVKLLDFGNGQYKKAVVMIYSKNPDNYLYAINNPLQCPDLLGYVDWKEHMGWHYWNIPDNKDPNTGEVYFRSRPMYKNGKMAGRF